MYNSTKSIALAIADGLFDYDNYIDIQLFNASTADTSDIITHIFRSKGILFGSPTYNSGILSSIAGLLVELKGLRLSGKVAAAFGSYG